MPHQHVWYSTLGMVQNYSRAAGRTDYISSRDNDISCSEKDRREKSFKQRKAACFGKRFTVGLITAGNAAAVNTTDVGNKHR